LCFDGVGFGPDVVWRLIVPCPCHFWPDVGQGELVAIVVGVHCKLFGLVLGECGVLAILWRSF
jgi:hypothetical protein